MPVIGVTFLKKILNDRTSDQLPVHVLPGSLVFCQRFGGFFQRSQGPMSRGGEGSGYIQGRL